jgi:DNA-binding transcriptional LysR family regulator
MLNPRRLRLLLELSERGTIAAVAEALQFTPSTVSQQLAALEHEAGVPLLERGPRSVRLTHAGTALAARAAEILASLSAARADVQAVGGLERGMLELASFPSAGATLVTEALAWLAAELPGLATTVVEAEPAESLVMLTEGEVDLAVVYEYAYTPLAPGDALALVHLLDDPMLACVPPALLPASGRLSLARLREERFVAGRVDSPCAAFARAACRDAGFEPEIAFETDDIGFTCALVAAGLGVALMPELLLRTAAGRPDTIPPEPALPPRRIYVAFRRAAERLAGVRAGLDALARAAAPRARA